MSTFSHYTDIMPEIDHYLGWPMLDAHYVSVVDFAPAFSLLSSCDGLFSRLVAMIGIEPETL
jgi:hypothetical protein